jgi:hypothetical protein
MPTPVGPVEPDPNDPELWPEWYDEEDWSRQGHGAAVRIVALVVVLGLVLLALAALI